MGSEHAWTVDEIGRDLDLVVFALERAPEGEDDEAKARREALRRQLERLRDRLQDLHRRMI